MVKPELGSKRVCVSCGTKFYDLARQPAVCPKCATEQPAEQPRLRRIAPLPPPEPVRSKPQPKPGLEDGDVDAEVEVEVEEDEEGVLEDTSDLEGDDAIVEVEPEGREEER